MRAIQLYHVKANGWNDIGYNALVDRFGTVYEGRHGGVEANVVGAHARGFNTGSFGIAVMGDFRTVDPPAEALDALVRTLAWRLDLAHVDPLGTFNGISSGNERFNPGVPVFLRAISGHRDTGLTTCPGERLYEQIPDLARKVAARGLPKLYAPSLGRAEAGGTGSSSTGARAEARRSTGSRPRRFPPVRGGESRRRARHRRRVSSRSSSPGRFRSARRRSRSPSSRRTLTVGPTRAS